MNKRARSARIGANSGLFRSGAVAIIQTQFTALPKVSGRCENFPTFSRRHGGALRGAQAGRHLLAAVALVFLALVSQQMGAAGKKDWRFARYGSALSAPPTL